jgi:hypothetical protein
VVAVATVVHSVGPEVERTGCICDDATVGADETTAEVMHADPHRET